MIRNAAIELGSHHYRSDWAITDCHYDMREYVSAKALLGMPWH